MNHPQMTSIHRTRTRTRWRCWRWGSTWWGRSGSKSRKPRSSGRSSSGAIASKASTISRSVDTSSSNISTPLVASAGARTVATPPSTVALSSSSSSSFFSTKCFNFEIENLGFFFFFLTIISYMKWGLGALICR